MLEIAAGLWHIRISICGQTGRRQQYRQLSCAIDQQHVGHENAGAAFSKSANLSAVYTVNNILLKDTLSCIYSHYPK